MLRLRHFRESDIEQIKAMHVAQGFGYELPDVMRDDFKVRAVIENGSGPRAAVFLRGGWAEAYLLADPVQGTRKEKLRDILYLTQEIPAFARSQGINGVFAMVPPEIEARFGKLMMHLGWSRHEWRCYTKDLEVK